MPIFIAPGPLGVVPAASRRFSGLNFGTIGHPPSYRSDWNWNNVPLAANKEISVFDSSPEAVSEGLGDIRKLWADEKIIKYILSLRDQAVYFSHQRIDELARWDVAAQERTKRWFNSADDKLRDFLINGITKTISVLNELRGSSFLSQTKENAELTGCRLRDDAAAAAVCPIDTVEHRILLGLGFFELRETTKIYGSDFMRDGDSQLSTIIHEVTHFKDVFGSLDTYYGIGNSLRNSHQSDIKLNADSLAGYILGMQKNKD